MDDQAQMLAMAGAGGWTGLKVDLAEAAIMGVHPRDRSLYLPVPNYLYSLDAMHEAEKVLTDEQRLKYVDWLSFRTSANAAPTWRHREFVVTHATARQRAEAFLRTLGLWVDEPQ